MKKIVYTTTRFEINEEFYVEVSPNGDMIEFVLCMKNYGLKSLMFGLYAKDCPENTWEELIDNNIEEYIESFLNGVYDVFESGFLDEHGFFDKNNNQ